jgi:hypothetical protein
MIESAVEISWKLDKEYFGFGVDLISYYAAVFSMYSGGRIEIW